MKKIIFVIASILLVSISCDMFAFTLNYGDNIRLVYVYNKLPTYRSSGTIGKDDQFVRTPVDVTISLNSIRNLIVADEHLLQCKSYGSLLTSFQATSGSQTSSDLNETYEALYDLMLSKATAAPSSGTFTPNVKIDAIYKISGTTTTLASTYFVMAAQKKIVFMADGDATLSISPESVFYYDDYYGSYSFQGKNESNRLTITNGNDYTYTLDMNNRAAGITNLVTSGSAHNNALIYNRASKSGLLHFAHICISKIRQHSKPLLYGENSTTGQMYMSYVETYKLSNDDSVYNSFWTGPQNSGPTTYIYKLNAHESMMEYTATNNDGGGFIRSYTQNQAKCYIESSRFENLKYHYSGGTNNTIHGGGAIYWKSSTSNLTSLWLKDCDFIDNYSGNDGGAILCCGSISITNCRFNNNFAKRAGGAIAIIPANSTAATVSGKGVSTINLDPSTTLTNNESNDYGGAISIYVSKSGNRTDYDLQLTIDGSQISGNKAKNRGGAISVYQSYDYVTGVTIKNMSKIYGNKVTNGDGGAVWLGYDGKCACTNTRGVSIEGGDIYGNSASGKGGAFYLNLPSTAQYGFNMQGGAVGTNGGNSANVGGALYLEAGKFSMSNGSMVNNSSNTQGGAIFLNSGSFALSGNASVSSNTAATEGGGAYVKAGGITLSDNAALDGNKATSGNGGGAFIVSGALTMYSGSISGNMSPAANGGGIYLAGGSVLVQGGNIGTSAKTNSALNGAGLFLNSGNVEMAGGSIGYNKATSSGGGIYLKDGTFKMTNGSILYNDAHNANGGGVFINSTNNLLVTLGSGDIMNNSAGGYGGGIGVNVASGKVADLLIGATCNGTALVKDANKIPTNIDVSSSALNIIENSSTSNGGAISMNGTANVYMYGGDIESNTTQGYGGAINMETDGSLFYLKGGQIISNKANGGNGGGVNIKSSGDFRLVGGSISSNTSTVNGGGISITNGTASITSGTISSNKATNGFGGGLYKGGNGKLTLSSGCAVSSNNAVNGGGVYVASGTVEMSGIGTSIASIDNNTASTNGGGLYINTGTFTLNGGDIVNNGATSNGGGLYSKGGEVTISNGNVNTNTSALNGGGICIEGNSTALNFKGGDISGNTAGVNGGGIYLGGTSTTLQFSNGNVLSNKATSGDGGGIYVAASDAITIVGGSANKNEAKNGFGGGIYSSGGTVTFSKGNINENKAQNGGGIALLDGAYMSFAKGFLTKNEAKPASSHTTVYANGNNKSLKGAGGGIYVGKGTDAKNTTLEFDVNPTDTLGILSNVADLAGDDVLADGVKTKLLIPDVSQMKLGGIAGSVALKWYEDFVTADSKYNNSVTARVDNTKTTYDYRFRYAMEHNISDMRSFETVTQLNNIVNQPNRYVALTMGYTFCDVIIKRYNLVKGESSIYLMKGEYRSYRIALNGNGEEVVQQVLKNVPIGKYTVTETPWSWAYNMSVPASRKLEQHLAEPLPDGTPGNIFTFIGTHKTGEDNLHHDENYTTDLLKK